MIGETSPDHNDDHHHPDPLQCRECAEILPIGWSGDECGLCGADPVTDDEDEQFEELRSL
jgi:hypothetical protein